MNYMYKSLQLCEQRREEVKLKEVSDQHSPATNTSSLAIRITNTITFISMDNITMCLTMSIDNIIIGWSPVLNIYNQIVRWIVTTRVGYMNIGLRKPEHVIHSIYRIKIWVPGVWSSYHFPWNYCLSYT